MTANFAKFQIRKWEVSYYSYITRKWLYGTLKVTVAGIAFGESKAKDGQALDMSVKFGDIAELKKTTTGLIFGAIVLVTNTGLKHWYSSLPDRDGIFNVLCYFKRCQLLPGMMKHKSNRSSVNRTEMGTRLLNITYDSQKTLQDAAETLHFQGSQIDSAISVMSDIDNDLNVADGLVSGLESWFGRWTIPVEYKYVEPMVICDSDLTDDLEYEVLYTKLETGRLNTQNIGLLRICKDGLYILTDKQKLVHNFGWRDISRVKVISLWEIMVTRFLIGQPDLSYSIVFTSLFTVLKILDKKLRSKVEYSHDVFNQMTEPESRERGGGTTPLKKQQDQLGSYKHTLDDDLTDIDLHTSESQATSKGPEMTTSEGQLRQSKQIVSNEEVTEISNVLNDLKSLALNVQRETDIQNEKLDKLNATVENTNVRIIDTEKRIKKIT